VIPVCDAPNTESDSQLASTEMSPAMHSEHSRKCHQRTGPRKKNARHFLPVISVCDAPNFVNNSQLASTEMSPAMHSEHSRKCHQRTGPRKKNAIHFLPVISVCDAPNFVNNLQLARTEISPAMHSEHSRKCRQRSGPRKKGAGRFLPEILVLYALNSDSALQLARTEISPVKHSEHSRKRHKRTAKEGCGKHLTQNVVTPCKKHRERLAIGQNSNVTCDAFGTFAEVSSADWSAKEGCRKLLTGDTHPMEESNRNVDMFEFLTISEHFDATCGTFPETSSADWSAKGGCGKLTSDSSAFTCVKYR